MTQKKEHSLYYDINKLFEDYLNKKTDKFVFCCMLEERLTQYRIDNNLE